LVLPWKPGYKAYFGIAGIHGTNSTWLPGSVSVDFLGGDTMGSDIMPPYAYAAADGVVTFACHGTNDTTIVVDSGAAGKFMYAHLNKNDSTLQEGMLVYQGRAISSLTYGSFSGGPCGTAADQTSSTYHLHFAFIPTDGYFLVGNCQLNIGTVHFLCAGVTYAVGSRIPNGGSVNPNPTPCGLNCVDPVVGGGDHIWNGIVEGIIASVNTVFTTFLTPYVQTDFEPTVMNLLDQFADSAWLIAGSQMIGLSVTVFFTSMILIMEGVRLIVVLWRWLLRMIPVMG
jgi:hypothetical protein